MQPLTSDTFMVDNTMIEHMTTCPWLAWATVIARRKSAGDAPALRYGGHIHKAMAYRYRMLGLTKQFTERNQDAMVRIIQSVFSRDPCDTEGWRNADSAVKTVRAYNSYYPTEQFDIAVNPMNGFPYVEQPFAVDTHRTIRGRKIIYMGRIDVKVRYPDGTMYVMDHKTSSMGGDSFWADQAMTGQHPGYVWADRECTGEEATGYIVNLICGKESLLNAEYNDLTGTLVPGKTATGRQSKAVPLELARQKFFTKVPPGQIDEWFENMLLQVDRFLYNVDTNAFPRHKKHCVGKYGQCQFYNVCSLPSESRSGALASAAYTENLWTPLYV